MKMSDKFRANVSQKGVGPIAIAIIIIVVAIVLESVIVTSLIADIEVMKRSAQETAVIKAIDTVEFAKRALENAVTFSFYNSSRDVFETGGYCSYITDTCTEDCLVPNNVPTNDCNPIWRVYTSVYAPEFGVPSAPAAETFVYYLASRMCAVYDDYSEQFLAPSYCPMPPGKVTMHDLGGISVRVDVNNTESAVVSYITENVGVVEYNTLFNKTVSVATLDIFGFAEDNFITGDMVGGTFNDVDSSMNNTWCAMVDDRCDVTSPCAKDCFGDSCCCKGMFLGDVCGANAADQFCDDQLSAYCSKGEADDCDLDGNLEVTADEQYKCDAQTRLYNGLVNAEGTIEASSSVDGCIETNHSSQLGYSNSITVHWESEVAADCDMVVNDNGCVCDIPCMGNEENCGGCASEDMGTFAGSCPWGAMACSAECCAADLTCVSSSTPGVCSGTNAAVCDSPSDCCEGGCDPACACDDCDLVVVCNAIGCPVAGPWLPECCNGPGDPKELVCESCCSEECTQKQCGDITGSRAACEACGCTYIPGGTTHTITPNCRANVCGLSCCVQTDTLYEDATCDYSYFGTARVDVEVKDVVNEYPIGNSWEEIALSFKVVSGNAPGCDAIVPVEESAYVADGSVCCPALTTNADDELAGCKSDKNITVRSVATAVPPPAGPSTPPEPSLPSPCVVDSDCCIDFASGMRVACNRGICDPALPTMGYLCP